MGLTIENNLPDIYQQRQQVDGIIRDVFGPGDEFLTVNVSEPADRVDWFLSATCRDGQTWRQVIPMDQQTQENLPRRLRSFRESIESHRRG